MTDTSKKKYKRNIFFLLKAIYKVRIGALYFNCLMNCHLEFKYITPDFEYTILLHMFNKTTSETYNYLYFNIIES